MNSVDFLKNYLEDFSWVAAGMGGAMVVDFMFYILAGRLMTPVEFGYFGVITSLYYIFLRSPFSVIETVAKKIQAEGGESMDVLGRKVLYLGLAMFGVFLLLSGPISSLLYIPRSNIIVFSMVFPLGYLLAALVGKVQGEQRFEEYGRYEFISSLTAFSMIIPVYVGLGAEAASAMFVVEIIAGAAYLSWKSDIELGSGSFEEYYLLKNSFLYVVGVHAAFSLDIIAVNYFFTSEVTGLYNTVAVLGKGLFFGSVAVNRSVFPKFVVDEGNRMKNLLLSQLLLVSGGLFAFLFMSVFGAQFISLTFGPVYSGAAAFGPHYMLMITGISSVALLSNYCISVDLDAVRLVALLPVLQTLLIILFHGTVHQVIYSTAVSALVLVAVLVLAILWSRS